MHYVWTAAEQDAIEEAVRRITAYERWLAAQRRVREDGRSKNIMPVAEDPIVAACPDSWRRQAAMGEEALRRAEIVRGGKPRSVTAKERGARAARARPNGHGLRKRRVA